MRAGIAFTVKGCPEHTQAPFPGGSPRLYWQQPSGAAAKPGGMATVRCEEFPPEQILGSETPPAACGRAESRVWGVTSPTGSAWCSVSPQLPVASQRGCSHTRSPKKPFKFSSFPACLGLSKELHFAFVKSIVPKAH